MLLITAPVRLLVYRKFLVHLFFREGIKHHRGRASSAVWVVGIVDPSTTPAKGYLQIVKKRDASTLLPIIGRVVRQGSTVCSDQWKAYYNIQRDLGLQHLTVNHSLHFVDAITGVHTQHIESYWNTKKTYIKAMKGCRRTHLEGYLNEFMWRDRFNDNAFYNLFSHIGMQYT